MLAIIDGDVLVYMAIWGADTKDEARENFDSLFDSILEDLFTEDYVMALGGPDNFRKELYSEYKSNRTKSKSKRPDWFIDLKSDIVRDYEGCILTDNCESDDMIRIWAHQHRLHNDLSREQVVVSVDKDLRCIPGKHFNPRTKSFFRVSANEADHNYWVQMLMGDSVDNIPGIPKIGPKTAEKLLKDCEFPIARKEVVCKAYSDYYGEDGYNYFLANGKLLHICRHEGDYFTFPKEKFLAYANH